jgi:hypothetical protein
MIHRCPLPNRRHHIIQEVRVAGQRALYLRVHNDEAACRSVPSRQRARLFCRTDRALRRNCLMSNALQYSAPREKVGNLLAGAKFSPCGPVSGFLFKGVYHSRFTRESNQIHPIGFLRVPVTGIH